jgi:hypothetical protein
MRPEDPKMTPAVRPLARPVFLAALALAFTTAPRPAAAQTAEWDQAKVTELAGQLSKATVELYDTFYKQPVPNVASGQARAYQKLKGQVRRIKTEARELSDSLGKGEGRVETQGNFDFLMQVVRAAEDNARQVFSTQQVREKADAARAVLAQIAPYYEKADETP